MKKILLSSLAVAGTVLLTGCAGGYEVSPNMVELNAKFAESKWDGKSVPKDGVCLDNDSNAGNSPSIIVGNLPTNTNKIVLSFSDKSNMSMDNGGHGVVAYRIKEGNSMATIPSFRSETYTLPTNFESVRGHSGAQWGKTPGAFLAPCSGGRGNSYSVMIEAIHDYEGDDKKSLLLGKTNLKLGRY